MLACLALHRRVKLGRRSHCRLQEEDSEEYGPPIVPESAVADAIMRRTKDHLRSMGGVAVSAKPICMRAEWVSADSGAAPMRADAEGCGIGATASPQLQSILLVPCAGTLTAPT